MSDTLTALCPDCIGRVLDPLTESAERCYAHTCWAPGLDDAVVSFVDAAPEAAVQRAACALIHGGRAATP